MRLFFIILLLFPITIFAQSNLEIHGKVTDSLGNSMDMVKITIEETSQNTYSNENGYFRLKIVPKDSLTLNFWKPSYSTLKIKLTHLIGISTKEINATLHVISRVIKKIDITDIRQRNISLIRLDPKILSTIPNASGNGIEALLKTLPGVSSNSELSSQYNVRGGNFDENLVYVNDIEIYRPFLVRTGNQEGLSFINSEMVSSVLFSAGGFEAKYGDKMSSVLDITYRKPNKFNTSVALSILGGSITTEGRTANQKFSYLSGFRYKTTQYLLNSLETHGEYRPSFTDWQTYLSYTFNKRWELTFLGNYSQNNYRFVPEDRSTSFGTINDAYNLYIDFEGNEIDKMTTSQGAISLINRPDEKIRLKWIVSGFTSIEEEKYDIEGKYSLNILDKRIGKTTGDSVMNLGIGRFLDHARNKITANVANISHSGTFNSGRFNVDWGVKYQYEKIEDKLNEWKLQDSAGYSIPQTSNSLTLSDALNSKINLQSSRFSGFVQSNFDFRIQETNVNLNFGVRGNYWSYNQETSLSPRFTIAFKPPWKSDLVSRLSVGLYTQSPFYRELRNQNGKLNPNPTAQKALHFVWGNDLVFTAVQRPFKLVTELYYKKLKDLIPYQVDNVRIRYYADQKANGYATGLDMRVNGEFVEGVDSWFSLSFLQTKEDIEGDGHGYIPRPSDQLITAGIFFQDYFPNSKSFKMHLTIVYGSGIPFGPQNAERHQSTMRMPAYKRVDWGISKVFVDENDETKPNRLIKNFVMSLEIFNLFGVSNTVSYLWVNVVPNTYSAFNEPPSQFAVPNRLTDRRLNLRLIAKF